MKQRIDRFELIAWVTLIVLICGVAAPLMHWFASH